jgi:intracellular septation protein
MQQLLDYIAILAFVVVYFISRDIFLATGVLMAGVSLQVTLYWLLKKPIGNELKVTFWACMILGGMTLILRDETFIQWKPTIVNWLLASALIGAHLVARTFLIKRMLGQVLVLPDGAWLVLTYGWAVGFAAAGALNLWVAYNYSMDTWVTFKFVGLLVLNMFFLICTFAYLYSKDLLTEEHLRDPKKNLDSTESGKL